MTDLGSTGAPADTQPDQITTAAAAGNPVAEPARDRLRLDPSQLMLGSSGAEHWLAPAHGLQVAAILSLLLWIAATILLWWLW